MFPIFAKEMGRNPAAAALPQREPSAIAHLQTAWTGSTGSSLQGKDLQSVYAVCTVCKLIFLLAAIKIKDLGITYKRYYGFYVLAFLSYDQGINPAFSACL